MAAEYDKPVEQVFKTFDPVPLGSASIAQVHTATLRNGMPVVVKVQRPGIRQTMTRDMSLLLRAAGLLNRTGVVGGAVDFQMVLREMWQITQQEMDFVMEAAHLEEFARRNKDIVYVACPAVHTALTTPQVLVMERVDGLSLEDPAALRKAGYDPHDIGEKLAESFSKQVLDDGFFHADPHSGNLRIRDKQIVFLDLGMMGRLREHERTLLTNAVWAFVGNDVSALKDVLLAFGVHSGPIQHTRLYDDVDALMNRYRSMGMEALNLGEIMQTVLDLAKTHGISMPEGLSMLGRSMGIVQSLLARLDPELNLFTILSNHLSAEMFGYQHVRGVLDGRIRALFASGQKALEIPAQVSDLLRTTIKGQTKVNFELTGSDEPIKRVDRMVDKLILALLISALLISAGLLSALSQGPRIGGIPVLGALGYGLAFLLVLRLWWIARRKTGRH
ncbi:MAG TPA: AarF/ABC1/UbiB kinase family protein [Clostridia bacterium]|nr:AarF/ABC1/UbiB kinase family protein [Clostridia bacterium]